MVTIEQVDLKSKAQVKRFIQVPFRLYKDHAQWVPPLYIDAETMLDPRKHPYYEHSDADFFIAVSDGRDIGRIAALENRNYNRCHHTHTCQFYLFDCENNLEAASALFQRIMEWAQSRNLDKILGPKGFGPLDGYGLLVEGFEHRQMMTMMNYNYPYYNDLLTGLGFEKEVDFVSCYLSAKEFHLPERIHSIADRVQQRGTLKVKRFQSKSELKSWAQRIGVAYNNAFVNNWEYVPLSENEVSFVLKNMLSVADHRLLKIITHEQDVVGFLFGWPDLSVALQRARGRLLPTGIFDILLEMRRTKWIALNGAGILPEFHGRGGNALLYSEMEKTIQEYKFEHADLTQVAETAVQMRADLINLGGKAYKNHRVYHKLL